MRKSDAAIRIAHKRLRQKASRKGRTPRPQSLEFAKCVIVFTTFPEAAFTAEAVLGWYRLRWQAELVFKRFKSVAQLGRLPKRDGESSRARLYGKLFAALLTEKLIAHASAVSPWGYDLAARPHQQQVAGVQIHAQSGPPDDRARHSPAGAPSGLARDIPRSLGADAKTPSANGKVFPDRKAARGTDNKLTLMGSSLLVFGRCRLFKKTRSLNSGIEMDRRRRISFRRAISSRVSGSPFPRRRVMACFMVARMSGPNL